MSAAWLAAILLHGGSTGSGGDDCGTAAWRQHRLWRQHGTAAQQLWSAPPPGAAPRPVLPPARLRGGWATKR